MTPRSWTSAPIHMMAERRHDASRHSRKTTLYDAGVACSSSPGRDVTPPPQHPPATRRAQTRHHTPAGTPSSTSEHPSPPLHQAYNHPPPMGQTRRPLIPHPWTTPCHKSTHKHLRIWASVNPPTRWPPATTCGSNHQDPDLAPSHCIGQICTGHPPTSALPPCPTWAEGGDLDNAHAPNGRGCVNGPPDCKTTFPSGGQIRGRRPTL